MKKAGWTAMVGMVFLMGSLMVLAACSSSSNSPTAPSGIGLGKAIYRDTAMSEGSGIPSAPVYVDGVPGLSAPGGAEVSTDANGYFEVYLAPDPSGVDPVMHTVEVRNPSNLTEVLWSNSVTVAADDTVVEPEVEVSNGIGPCVSECVHLYNPSNGVPPEELISLGATKNGKFNATPCVNYCKENYRGGLPGEPGCNPFYSNYNSETGVCSEETVPGDPEVIPAGQSDSNGNANANKPKKPKSNNGQGNGNF